MRSDRGVRALQAIVLHATEAMAFVEGVSLERFRENRLTFHAVTRCLEIISEATRRVPDGLKVQHPNIPWRDIADAGNLYRHDYDNVAADLVYRTATHDLDPLLVVARNALNALAS